MTISNSFVQRVRLSALRQLSRNYILVTGCQRSGTTLMLLILDAHARIVGKDESEDSFRFHPGVRSLSSDLAHRMLTCRKIPAASGDLSRLKEEYPYVRVIWMVRNPLSVISSMRNLRLTRSQDQRTWLELYAKSELNQLSRLFPTATNDIDSLSLLQQGALIWSLNCEAFSLFQNSKLKTKIIKYENLLSEPEMIMRDIVSFLDLQWDDSMLSFHSRNKNANRELAGGTKGGQKIDKSRLAPNLSLTPGECQEVLECCRVWAEEFGYTNDSGIAE